MVPWVSIAYPENLFALARQFFSPGNSEIACFLDVGVHGEAGFWDVFGGKKASRHFLKKVPFVKQNTSFGYLFLLKKNKRCFCFHFFGATVVYSMWFLF